MQILRRAGRRGLWRHPRLPDFENELERTGGWTNDKFADIDVRRLLDSVRNRARNRIRLNGDTAERFHLVSRRVVRDTVRQFGLDHAWAHHRDADLVCLLTQSVR